MELNLTNEDYCRMRKKKSLSQFFGLLDSSEFGFNYFELKAYNGLIYI